MKRKWVRFGLQSFFACILLIALVAMALGWRADRIRLQETVQTLQRQQQLLRRADPAIYSKTRLFSALNQPGVVGRAVAEFPDVRRLADERFGVHGRVSDIWQEALKNVPGQQCTGYFFSFGDPQESEEYEAAGFDVLTVDDRIALVRQVEMIW
ncbi:MAG: hypothetical protein ACYC0X_05625 [Pirellulaceae bacterium]